MGAVKSWMMDMEQLVEEAIVSGIAKNESEILAHVKSNMSIVDEKHVKEHTIKILGEF